MSDFKSTVNATEYPPHLKHKVIFESFDSLNPGETMLLINDHDPVPLQFQLKLERAGQFEWDYLERGPEQFKIQIRRVTGA